MVFVGVSVALANRRPPPPPPLEIPDSLAGRAAVFGDALARRDMEVLIRLTDPAQYRALRTWLAHGQDEAQRPAEPPASAVSLAEVRAAHAPCPVRRAKCSTV